MSAQSPKIGGSGQAEELKMTLLPMLGPALLVFLTLLGCGEKGAVRVSDRELYGSYAGSFEAGKEQLILHSDKTYAQIFASPKKQFTNQGKWQSSTVFLGGTEVELIGATAPKMIPRNLPRRSVIAICRSIGRKAS
jgi:hypothetical protein